MYKYQTWSFLSHHRGPWNILHKINPISIYWRWVWSHTPLIETSGLSELNSTSKQIFKKIVLLDFCFLTNSITLCKRNTTKLRAADHLRVFFSAAEKSQIFLQSTKLTKFSNFVCSRALPGKNGIPFSKSRCW